MSASGLRTRMPKDPPVRDDGRCAQCGKPRRPERSRSYGGYAAEADAFCSTDCCRVWHGCEVGGHPSTGAEEDE
jgi:hypothetical protein